MTLDRHTTIRELFGAKRIPKDHPNYRAEKAAAEQLFQQRVQAVVWLVIIGWVVWKLVLKL